MLLLFETPPAFLQLFFVDISDVVQIVWKHQTAPEFICISYFADLYSKQWEYESCHVILLQRIFFHIQKPQHTDQVYLQSLMHINLKAAYFFLSASVCALSQQGLLWAFQGNMFRYTCMYNVTQTVRILKDKLPSSRYREHICMCHRYTNETLLPLHLLLMTNHSILTAPSHVKRGALL